MHKQYLPIIPRSPHFPYSQRFAIPHASEHVDKFIRSLFRPEQKPVVHSNRNSTSLSRQRKELAFLDEQLRISFLTIKILTHSLENANHTLKKLTLARKEAFDKANSLCQPRNQLSRLPVELIEYICSLAHDNGSVQPSEVHLGVKRWGNVFFRSVEMAIDRFTSEIPPAAPMELDITLDTAADMDRLLTNGVTAKHRWKTLTVLHRDGANTGAFWRTVDKYKRVIPSVSKLTFDYPLDAKDDGRANMAYWDSISQLNIKTADVPLRLVPVMRGLLRRVKTLTIRLGAKIERKAPSHSLRSYFKSVSLRALSSLTISLHHNHAFKMMQPLFQEGPPLSLPLLSALTILVPFLKHSTSILAILNSLTCPNLKSLNFSNSSRPVPKLRFERQSDAVYDPVIKVIIEKFKNISTLRFDVIALGCFHDKERVLTKNFNLRILNQLMSANIYHEPLLPRLTHLALPYKEESFEMVESYLSGREFARAPIRTLELTCPPPALSLEQRKRVNHLGLYVRDIVVTQAMGPCTCPYSHYETEDDESEYSGNSDEECDDDKDGNGWERDDSKGAEYYPSF